MTAASGLVPLAETRLFAAQPVRKRQNHWLHTAAASGTNQPAQFTNQLSQCDYAPDGKCRIAGPIVNRQYWQAAISALKIFSCGAELICRSGCHWTPRRKYFGTLGSNASITPSLVQAVARNPSPRRSGKIAW